MLRSTVTLLTLALTLALATTSVHAGPPAGKRDFYGALDDLLGDFEYDLKHETVKGTENIAVREIMPSENIPHSFIPHIEDLLAERMLRATKTKVIKCIGCKARRTSLVGKDGGDKITMTSPRTNAQELASIAKQQGIRNFLDVTFTYQPTGLIMSMTINEPGSSIVVWSRTYNSESSRAAMLRRGYDSDQLDASTRRATEYPASLQYRLRVDYFIEPDIGGLSGCLGLAFRMVERYDNRKKELGFEIQYLRGTAALLHPDAANVSLYAGINATLLVLHAWNLIGGKEDFNLPRASLYGGIGGTYTSGFAGALFRVGGEYRMGRHSAVTAHLGYRPASTSFLPLGDGESVSGPEIGAGISFLF